jgi:tetratricopeptide (TPR) repeat protein
MTENTFKEKVEELFLTGKRPYLWIGVVGLLIYFRSLFFDFTYLDDNVLILDNLFYLKNLGNIFKIFTIEVFHVLHASAAYYRPLLTLSFMIDAQFSGANPFVYHLTNVLLHLASGMLLFKLLTKIKVRDELALFTALFFTVLPVLSQAVSWVPGRNDSLLAFFVIPTFINLINYLETEKFKYFVYYLVFFAASLFTKESALLIPLFTVMYIVLFERKRMLTRQNIYLIPAIILVLLPWYLLRRVALVNPVEYGMESVVKTIISAWAAVPLYVGKIFVPYNLSVLPTVQDSKIYLGSFVVIVLTALVLMSKQKRWSYILFGTFWFFGFLLPSFVRPSTEYVPDFIEHRLYVPIIGLFFIILEIDFVKNLNLFNKKVAKVAGVLLVLFAAITFFHTGVFANKMNFWLNAAKYSPRHPLAHKNLGAMYYLDGDIVKSEVHFKQSLVLNPTEPMIHNNLGLIYLSKNDFQNAEKEFAQELELYPYYDNAHYNWGLSYFKRGEKAKAEDMWLKTLQINPDHVGAYQNLAVLYYEQGKADLSQKYYTEAVKRGAR